MVWDTSLTAAQVAAFHAFYSVSNPTLQLVSVEGGICHLEWSPAANYYLEFDSLPRFDSHVSVPVAGPAIWYYFDAGAGATEGFSPLVPQ